MKSFVLIFIFFIIKYTKDAAGGPCAARQIPHESVVCVCNTTYCDDVIRKPPADHLYVVYTSSKSGLRFNRTEGEWKQYELLSDCPTTLELVPNERYQKIEGFGGAVTDAAGINWRSLPPVLQDSLINSYYGPGGLEYNMVRTPIGGSDFSTRPYAYNELPRDDVHLSNYTLAPEDYMYKIPMIKDIMNTSVAAVHVVATTWSPPLWMKHPEKIGGYNRLKPEYYQTYADYYLKFIEKYDAEGIPVWGITTTNEPINGVFALAGFNSLGWTVQEMGAWIEHNLGPTVRGSPYRHVKILTGDDQRITVPYWFNMMAAGALQYVDGLAVHWYTDRFTPPTIFEAVTRAHPDKFILATEACEGTLPWQREKVLLGSWERARSYIIDILQDLNYNLVGWIDWNLCVNPQGGPNWVSNFADSAIIVDKRAQEFLKQPMFYALGHFAKFIPRGSVRIKVKENKSFLAAHLHNVAFVTPRQTIVVVIHNDGSAKCVRLKNGNQQTTLNLEADSITTVEFAYTENE